MNKAFTKDDDWGEAAVVPPRAPLPEGMPNYVTPRGIALLREEQSRLQADRLQLDAIADEGERRHVGAGLAARAAALADRIATVVIVERSAQVPEVIRFGARVKVLGEGGERVYEIVGVDEADGTTGRIAFVSPLARALIGKRAGDVALVRTPRGDEELEIVDVGHAEP